MVKYTRLTHQSKWETSWMYVSAHKSSQCKLCTSDYELSGVGFKHTIFRMYILRKLTCSCHGNCYMLLIYDCLWTNKSWSSMLLKLSQNKVVYIIIIRPFTHSNTKFFLLFFQLNLLGCPWWPVIYTWRYITFVTFSGTYFSDCFRLHTFWFSWDDEYFRVGTGAVVGTTEIMSVSMDTFSK